MPISNSAEHYGIGATPLENNADIGLHVKSDNPDIQPSWWIIAAREAKENAERVATAVASGASTEKRPLLPHEVVLATGRKTIEMRTSKEEEYNTMLSVNLPPAA